MPPNKFASMLHRSTNRLTLVLVYALLEWILIAMILLNSLFSYLILKYADYFGLNRPCVLCSRIDHGRDKRLRRDMICHDHALEISDLRFSPTHQALERIEKGSSCFCSDDSSVSPVLIETRDLHFFNFSGAEDVGLVAAEEDEDSQLVSAEVVVYEDDEGVNGTSIVETDQGLAPVPETESRGLDGDSESGDDIVWAKLEVEEAVESVADISDEAQALKNNDREHFQSMEIEEHEEINETENESGSEFLVKLEIEEHEETKETENESGSEFLVKLEIEEHEETKETETESGSEFLVKLEIEEHEETKETETESGSEFLVTPEIEEQKETKETENESGSDYLVKLEIEEHEAEYVVENALSEQAQTLTGDETVDELEAAGFALNLEVEEEKEEARAAAINNHVQHETCSAVEASLDRILETDDDESGPSALDEDPETHESSELASTVERLTMALDEAYAELEQERNDAAEASAQTMAMITKLQEEKAALQLEASQYQRMMDEQFEFDQDAVLLLDEIVRRRERENQELEKELELYRRRFTELEKMRRSEDQNTVVGSESVSVCCSSFGDQDSDGVSTEDDEHHPHPHHHHHHHQSVTAHDDDDPVLDFENERLCILNQLNKLEQKLSDIDEGEEPKHEDDDSIVEHHGSIKKSRMEEEVGRVYERLQALEEGEEFLNKCMKSMKKGDEGMSLVQEILHHLRALRRMEES